jgi:hypothetical protein
MKYNIILCNRPSTRDKYNCLENITGTKLHRGYIDLEVEVLTAKLKNCYTYDPSLSTIENIAITFGIEASQYIAEILELEQRWDISVEEVTGKKYEYKGITFCLHKDQKLFVATEYSTGTKFKTIDCKTFNEAYAYVVETIDKVGIEKFNSVISEKLEFIKKHYGNKVN